MGRLTQKGSLQPEMQSHSGPKPFVCTDFSGAPARSGGDITKTKSKPPRKTSSRSIAISPCVGCGQFILRLDFLARSPLAQCDKAIVDVQIAATFVILCPFVRFFSYRHRRHSFTRSHLAGFPWHGTAHSSPL